MAAVPALLAVFPADVMAVDPMMPEARHMSRDPNHFIVVGPIPRAMAVEWPVANLDFDAIRSNSGRNKNTRANNGNEQKFVVNHVPLIHATHRAGQYLLGGT